MATAFGGTGTKVLITFFAATSRSKLHPTRQLGILASQSIVPVVRSRFGMLMVVVLAAVGKVKLARGRQREVADIVTGARVSDLPARLFRGRFVF